MKKNVLVFLLMVGVCFNSFAGCSLYCKVKYYYEVTQQEARVTQQGYSSEGFSAPTYAASGTMPYANSKYVESDIYTVTVNFYSGFELNEYYGKYYYKNNSIIAIINWDNGGSSFILINDWITNLKYVNENEIKYNENGQRIYNMYGSDNNNIFWSIYIV